MTPVDQTISDHDIGDCMRAVVASLLDVRIEAVPHFLLVPGEIHWHVFTHYVWAMGWEYSGCVNYSKDGPNEPKEEDSIGGHFYASVPSRNFEGRSHAVVIDRTGLVVHDPSPTKKYQGENVFETGAIHYWLIFTRRTDEEWQSWQKKGAA